MNVNIELTDEKKLLLGKVIARAFKLEQKPNGYFNTSQGNKSFIGLACIVEATMADALSHSVEELRKMLAELEAED